MAEEIANVEQLHLHIRKPGTSTDPTPQARCRNCTRKGFTKLSYWICSQCSQRPGLCSKKCFEEYHGHGFEILLAARPLRTDAAPDEPNQEQVVHEIPEVIQETDTDKLSAVEWQKIQERQHVLTEKPPTKSKDKPRLACIECKYSGSKRNDVRTICRVCLPQRGLCSDKCLKENHIRTRIFQPTQPGTSSDPEIGQPSTSSLRPVGSSTPVQGNQTSSDGVGQEDERRSLAPEPDQTHEKSFFSLNTSTPTTPLWESEEDSLAVTARGPRTPPGPYPYEDPPVRLVPYRYEAPPVREVPYSYPSFNLFGKYITPTSPPSQEETPEDGKPSPAISKKRPREPEDEDPTSNLTSSPEDTSKINTRSRTRKNKEKEKGKKKIVGKRLKKQLMVGMLILISHIAHSPILRKINKWYIIMQIILYNCLHNYSLY